MYWKVFYDELFAMKGAELEPVDGVVYFRGIRKKMDFQSGVSGEHPHRIRYAELSQLTRVHAKRERDRCSGLSKGSLNQSIARLEGAGLVRSMDRPMIFSCPFAMEKIPAWTWGQEEDVALEGLRWSDQLLYLTSIRKFMDADGVARIPTIKDLLGDGRTTRARVLGAVARLEVVGLVERLPASGGSWINLRCPMASQTPQTPAEAVCDSSVRHDSGDFLPPPPSPSGPPHAPRGKALVLAAPGAPGAPDEAEALLGFLNGLAGTSFRAKSSGKPTASYRLASERIREYGLEKMKRVVLAKNREWTSPDMRKYLRPMTLFNRTKAEQYVGALDASEIEPEEVRGRALDDWAYDGVVLEV